jgi:hypothetical protein
MMGDSNPSSILVCGDWHGDARHALHSFQAALNEDVDCLLVVGDYGYWEHIRGGPEFLEVCSDLATQNDLPLFWIDGNHENHTLLRERYGPGGPQHKLTPEGFWEIRPGVYYIPRGTRWTWGNVRMMGLGGAYSVDKFHRLKAETKAYRDHVDANKHRTKAGAPTRPFDPAKHKRWWAEEQISDVELAYALRDPEPVDILFTHDKPLASTPAWNRKPYAECLPNAEKIQTVVNALNPKLLVHGHLHFRYTDYIRNGDPDGYTQVEGLSCNPESQDETYDPGLSYLRIDLTAPQ